MASMKNAEGPYVPATVKQIELTAPLDAFDGSANTQTPADSYPPANSTYLVQSALVTIHHRPIGVVKLSVGDGPLSPADVAEAIHKQLGGQIRKHLTYDSVSDFRLTARGLEVENASDNHALMWKHAPCWLPLIEPSDLPRISIVVATCNRAEQLRLCVDRITALDYPDFEIVIVDNGSSDNSTKNMYYEHFADHPGVSYRNLPEPGVSIARNIGLQLATGEIVAFTDDDVVPDPNWLYALAHEFRRNPDVDCVTGLVLPASLDHQPQQWFEEYGGFNKGYQSKVFTRRRRPGYTVLYPYSAGTFGSGNNCAFRKNTLVELRGFDGDLGPGTITRAGEDLDAFLAVIMNKGKIAYQPAAIIYHYHRDSYLALRKQLFNYGIGLSAIFVKWAMVSPRNALDILVRIPLGLWVLLNPKSHKNKGKSPSFPHDLTAAELRGMAVGPLLFALRKLGAK